MVSPLQRFGPLALIVVVGVAMAAWSWGTWPDPVIDFGRELYVPWQLAQGKVLYRDVAYFNGPLSPYVNALWFRCFGATLRTLVICNLAIVAAITAMTYALFLRLADHWAATGAAVAFLLLFAFSRYEWVGNSNYVCPYSHETTHGVALALAMLLLLDRYLRGSRWALGAAGFVLGLVFLTKVEIFVAAAGAAGVAICLAVPARRESPRKTARAHVYKGRDVRHWRSMGDARLSAPGSRDSKPRLNTQCVYRVTGDVLLLLGAMLVAPVVAWLALREAMPGRQAFLGTLGSWHYTFNSRLSTLLYFKIGTGLLEPGESLKRLLYTTFGVGAAIAFISVPAWLHNHLGKTYAFDDPRLNPVQRDRLIAQWPRLWRQSWNRVTRPICVIFALLFGAFFLLIWRVVPWLEVPRVLPLVMLILGALGAQRWLRNGSLGKQRRAAFLLVVTVFAFALLLKMILNARISNYGYFLALPASLLSIAVLLTWIPRWFTRQRRWGSFFRAGAAAVLVVFTAWHLSLCAFHFRELTVQVGSGPNAFYAGGRGASVNEAVKLINQHVAPWQTVAVLPEGAMINFLSGRVNPTPYIIFMPSDLIMFGENRVISSFAAHPPDYIVLVHKDTSEYGYRYFGQDYGLSLMNWIKANYDPRPAGTIGDEPFRDGKFGIRIYRRYGS